MQGLDLGEDGAGWWGHADVLAYYTTGDSGKGLIGKSVDKVPTSLEFKACQFPEDFSGFVEEASREGEPGGIIGW